jgi:FlaA1/EpsC-like NDP-sugar epimerase
VVFVPRLKVLLTRLAGPIEVILDVSAWVAAAWLAVYMRFEFSPPVFYRNNLIKFIPILAAVQLIVGLITGLYRRRWRYGSFDEVAALAMTSAITTLIAAVINAEYLNPRLVPMSAIWFAGFVGLVLMSAARYVWRLILEHRRRPGDDAARTIVFGAGEGGVQIIQSMLRSPTSPYLPVAILDDDPSKRRLSISGVPVIGGRGDLAAAANRLQASVLLVAVPSASGDLLKALMAEAEQSGLSVKVLPIVEELLGAPEVGDIRDLSESDLLGRHQVDLDLTSIAGYVNGRRVLVTGAGGSIGSELCRQLSRFGPRELMMLDRDESALHEVQMSLDGRALLDTPEVILCDIRDSHALTKVFLNRRPQVVFHAAALKHLPMLEQYPAESVKSNVWGTQNVLEAASIIGVQRFVNISTDKAANPESMLGYSKRVAEQLTAGVAKSASGVFLSVRFGNVLNSRGSVLTTFRDQIARGGPVTVTHPAITRYFMTIPEAVQLLIQAGAIGKPGEVLVLDMGAPVKILDVARRMIASSGKKIPIEITGLRPGEKLHEDLFGREEVDERPIHKMISHASVPGVDRAAVGWPVDEMQDDEIREALATLCAATEVVARTQAE